MRKSAFILIIGIVLTLSFTVFAVIKLNVANKPSDALIDNDNLQNISLSQMVNSKNLFDKNSITKQKTLRNGNLVDNATYSVSDFISVKPNTEYISNKTILINYFDNNKDFLSQISVKGEVAIKTPSNAAYVKLAVISTRVAALQFEIGDKCTEYEDYKGEKVSSNEAQDKLKSLSILNGIEKNLKIAFVGSSITWGDGFLDSSFVGHVDDYLRNELADTIMHYNMTYEGTKTIISNKKFYKETATKLSGIASTVDFKLSGNELSLSYCKERDNAGASIVELYVDETLYDSFSTYNKEPNGKEQKKFTGDGKTTMFDLGRPFTYGHIVKIDGVTKNGDINTQGLDAKMPVGNDYMIIRKYSTNATGNTEVHHYVLFSKAPAVGVKIVVDFSYGENIIYAKTTIGETAAGVNSPLESRYGDGSDIGNPKQLATGLDFRYTDSRAVKTWRFTDKKIRNIKFKIKSLDPRVDKGLPTFIINFATNRFHHIMNAGIGGSDSREFLNNKTKKGIPDLIKFNPDIVIFESGTNDDKHCSFVAYRTIKGLKENQVRRLTTLWLKTCSYVGTDNYTIETSVLKIADATSRSLAINPRGVTFGDVKAGDILIIGDYHGDNREMQARVIDRWDSKKYIASFKKPLQFNGMFGLNSPTDLIGKDVRIRSLDNFETPYIGCIDSIRDYNPEVKIGLLDTGLSNYKSRTLLGYPEKIADVARTKNCTHIKLYDLLSDWQYSQKKDLTAYLNTVNNTTADGSSSYNLVKSSGKDLNDASFGLRNFSVKVNGIEVYGDGCYIDGGRGYSFAPEIKASELIVKNWSTRTQKLTNMPLKLVFTNNVPAFGAKIDVTCSSLKWSFDDTHLHDQAGEVIYSNAIIDGLKKLIIEAL